MRYRVLPVLVGTGVLCFSQSAFGATLTVDDNRADCPAAAYTSIQAAVDAAAPGDTITICPGSYAEGSGAIGTNALTISKSLTLKGAGADLVKITPKSSGPASGQIMEAAPDLRNGVGDIIAVDGTPSQPLTVNISGITADGWDPQGRPVAVEAGIVFLDAKGSVNRSRVTDVVTSEGNDAYLDMGGYRNTQPGVGIAQVTNALYAPVDGARRLEITRTRVDKYNKIGILIDGAENDTPPLTQSGTVDWGVITASQVIGRTQCINYQGTGNCSLSNPGNPGGPALATGPLFGQDGVRVTSGSYATIDSSTISQNLVLGTNAPVRGAATNNANLTMGAGVRYIDAKMSLYTGEVGLVRLSQITNSNIIDNAYGAMNLKADGTTAQTGNVVPNTSVGYGNLLIAENNWWGLYDLTATSTGPAIAPTTNPNPGENPVNGVATPNPAVPTPAPSNPNNPQPQVAGTTSSSVDFFPYRSGSQSDPQHGQIPVLTAPIPISDAAPEVTLSAPATADRGTTITLTANPTDDIGVKKVRFTDGSATAGTATTSPYTQSVTIPADAACGSTRSYSAIATDSLNQTGTGTAAVPGKGIPANPGKGSVAVTVTCPTTQPAPAKPTIAFVSPPTTIKSSAKLTLNPTAAAGLKSIAVFLGNRQVCTITAAPFTCTVQATGADVGNQVLRAVVTDALGSTAEATQNLKVAKFASKLSMKVTKKSLSHSQTRRTISGKVTFPAVVTKAQGCTGTVTLVIKRAGKTLLNQQVKVSKTCTFSRSVTAARSKQTFSVSAKFGGNAALASTSLTRRFS